MNLATLRADPLFVVSPNANGAFPPGTHTRTTWGGGFQIGAELIRVLRESEMDDPQEQETTLARFGHSLVQG